MDYYSAMGQLYDISVLGQFHETASCTVWCIVLSLVTVSYIIDQIPVLGHLMKQYLDVQYDVGHLSKDRFTGT